MGYRGVTADTCNIAQISKSGKVGAVKTPAEITSAIIAGSGLAEFDLITAPTLGIFAHPQTDPPYYSLLTSGQKQQYRRSIVVLTVWQDDVIQRFSSGIKRVKVIKLSNSTHYIYLNNEELVVRHMRNFLLGE